MFAAVGATEAAGAALKFAEKNPKLIESSRCCYECSSKFWG